MDDVVDEQSPISFTTEPILDDRKKHFHSNERIRVGGELVLPRRNVGRESYELVEISAWESRYRDV